MKLSLLRHLQTEGNKQGRYIGVTDEPLAPDAAEGIDKSQYKEAEVVYVSPLLRCRQTAAILYPGKEQIVCDGLRECDFGLFENKNYMELSGDPRYQEWIDSNGTIPFPKGESREAFQERTTKAFYNCLFDAKERGKSCVAFLVHGGTIMSIMEAMTGKPGSYYDWQCGNGNGYYIDYRQGEILSMEEIQGKRK